MPSLTEIVKDIDLTRVKHVASIADLQGLDLENIEAVLVGGYHAGSTDGGGLFVKATGRHDGGTFIDPDRPFPTDWSSQEELTAWFADSGSDVAGFHNITNNVSCKHFGTGFGVDDFSAITAWCSRVAKSDVDVASLVGDINLSRSVEFDLLNNPIVINLSCDFIATSAIEGNFITWSNVAFSSFEGRAIITGTGSSVYSSRTCDKAMLMNGVPRSQSKCTWRIRFFKYDGVSVISSPNSNGFDFGNLFASDCGSKTGDINLPYTSAVNNGSSGSVNQTATLNIGSQDIIVRQGDVALVDGNPHLIDSYDQVTGDLIVFPWLESLAQNSSNTTGTVDLILGSSVLIEGPDSGIINFGAIYSTGCSRVYDANSLYGIVAKRVVMQSNTIGLLIGRRFDAAHVTDSIRGFYTEDNEYDIIKATSGNVGLQIEAPYASDDSRLLALSPRITGGDILSLYEGMEGVSYLGEDGVRQFLKQSPRNYTTTTVIKNLANQHHTHHITSSSSVFRLKYDDDTNRLWGNSGFTFDLYRKAGNLVITISLDDDDIADGWTFEDGTTINKVVNTTVKSASVKVLADVLNKVWLVSYIENVSI